MTNEDQDITIANIINRLEKLETFKKDTILDINEYDEYLDKLTDHLNALEKRTIVPEKRTDYPKFKDTVKERLNKDDGFHDAMVNEITDMDRVSDLLKSEVKDKIVINFLELNKDINGDEVERLMEVPVHKRKDFEKEDLDNAEQVYWACKILLEYVGDYEEWKI